MNKATVAQLSEFLMRQPSRYLIEVEVGPSMETRLKVSPPSIERAAGNGHCRYCDLPSVEMDVAGDVG